MLVRDPEPGDVAVVVTLASLAIGTRRAEPFVRAHLQGGELLVAEQAESR